MLDPATLVTENTDERTDRLIVALVRLHAPVLPVWQLAMPPTEKLPLTVALATAAPVLILRIVTVALAFQLELKPLLEPQPVIDFTATACTGGSVGAPAASEKTSRLGESVPTTLMWFVVALAVRKDATAAGDAVVLAASASAAMPVTWGVAIDVPLIAGRQTNECLPPIHMAN